MNSVTIEQALDWNPCAGYNRERITGLFAGRENLTILDILALDIPAADRLWAVLRNEFFTDEQLHTLACDFAEHVVHLCGDDPRPQAAIDAKRAWLRGEISAAAWAAASAAAWDAAWAAGRAAGRDAARAAARAAAWAATWAAASDAARDAAWDAEQEWQLERIAVVAQQEA